MEARSLRNFNSNPRTARTGILQTQENQHRPNYNAEKRVERGLTLRRYAASLTLVGGRLLLSSLGGTLFV